jgi:hypothetical protein
MMPQVSALDVNIAGLNRRLSDVTDTVRNLIAHHSDGFNRFIENFERDLASGTVNIDDYCNNAKDLMRDEIQNLNNLAQVEGKGQVLKSTLLTLMEVRRYGLLKPGEVEELEAELENVNDVNELLTAINGAYGMLASLLHRVACEQEDTNVRYSLVLLAESLINFSLGASLPAMAYFLASLAIAHGRKNIATALTKKIGDDLEQMASFACGVVKAAKSLEERGIYLSGEDTLIARYGNNY